MKRVTDNPAIPIYLSRLGMDRAPFSGHGEEFFYADPEREQYLNMLQHLTQYSEEVLMVGGPKGSGKTALLEEFLARADEQWKVCRIDAKEYPSAGDLFLFIAEFFGLDTRRHDADRLLDALKSHLATLGPTRVPVLVVDDAHLLPDDALEVIVRLAELDGPHGRLLRVVLLGEPRLSTRLGQARFKGVARPHELILKPLDSEQTGAYLLHRLAAAGYEGDDPFSKRQRARIRKISGGWPAAINQAAHAELARSATVGGRAALLSRLSPLQWSALGATVAVVATILVFQDAINTLFSQATREVPPPLAPAPADKPAVAAAAEPEVSNREAPPRFLALKENLVAATPPKTDADSTQQVVTARQALKAAVTPAVVQLLAPLPSAPHAERLRLAGFEEERGRSVGPAANVEAPQAETAPAPVEHQAERPAPVTTSAPKRAPQSAPQVLITAVAPDTLVGSWDPQELLLTGSGFSREAKVTVQWGENSKSLPASRVQVPDAEHLKISLTTGVAAGTWKVIVSSPGGSDTAVFQVVSPSGDSAVSGGVDGVDWVRRQPGGHFTIQLLVTKDETRIGEFVKEHGLSGQLARFPVRKGERLLHTLVKGSFASRGEAERVAAALPAALRAQSPWIRRFDTIHPDQAPAGAEQSSPTTPTIKREPWLWTRDPRHFAIQLVAASDEQAILDFLDTHTLPGVTAVLRTVRDGKPWYALTYGNFETREAAEQAVRRLPKALQRSEPWIRTFASIHDDLARATP